PRSCQGDCSAGRSCQHRGCCRFAWTVAAMSYQDALEQLGSTAERSILNELRRYTSGQISLDTFVDLAATIVALGQQQGRMAAEVSLLAWLQSIGAAAVPVAAPPIDHYMNSDRVRDAIWTVVGTGVEE